MSSLRPVLQLASSPAEEKKQPMQPNPRPYVYQERKTHRLSSVFHELKFCWRLLCAGTSLNTFLQHTVGRLLLWPESEAGAMEHPLVHGVMNSDLSEILSCPSRAHHGCFNVVSGDDHLPSPAPYISSLLRLPLVLLWPCPWWVTSPESQSWLWLFVTKEFVVYSMGCLPQ